MASSTSFTRFPDLPPELRRKIWAAALDHPKLIIHKQRRGDSPLLLPPEHHYRSRPSILLQVCQESRAEAILRYQHLALKDSCSLGPHHCLNPSVDIVYLSHTTCRRPFPDVLGGPQHTLFSRSLGSQAKGMSPRTSPWAELRAVAICSTHGLRLIERLARCFPSLTTLYLLQAPEEMHYAGMLKKNLEDYLEQRRKDRGDGNKSKEIEIEVVSWRGLLEVVGQWEEEVGGMLSEGNPGLNRCETCSLTL